MSFRRDGQRASPWCRGAVRTGPRRRGGGSRGAREVACLQLPVGGCSLYPRHGASSAVGVACSHWRRFVGGLQLSSCGPALSAGRVRMWAVRPQAEEATCREAYLSAQRPEACQASRIPSPHGRSCWSRRAEGPSPQGSGPVVGLIGSVRDRAAFDALRRTGRRARSGPVRVRYIAEPRGASARVAYAIGRTVGGAVTRNRVRRRLRAAFLDLDRRGLVPPGVYLVSVGPDASSATYAALVADLAAAVERAAETGR